MTATGKTAGRQLAKIDQTVNELARDPKQLARLRRRELGFAT